MTRVIYVVGNDGSGKTTYSTNLRERLPCRPIIPLLRFSPWIPLMIWWASM